MVGTAIAGVKAVAKNESGANLAATIEETLLKGIPLALNFAVKQVPGLVQDQPAGCAICHELIP